MQYAHQLPLIKTLVLTSQLIIFVLNFTLRQVVVSNSVGGYTQMGFARTRRLTGFWSNPNQGEQYCGELFKAMQ